VTISLKIDYKRKRPHASGFLLFNKMKIKELINVVSVVVRYYPGFFGVFIHLTTTWRSGKLPKENEFYFYLFVILLSWRSRGS
jgi:hypothetical protein